MPIAFFSTDISFVLEKKGAKKLWLKNLLQLHGITKSNINYIFCSDEYLIKINQQYLDHDTYTDIITFDLRENLVFNQISGEIYISIERVKENSEKQNTEFELELLRVMSHGILHLLGYKDKTNAEKQTMRKEEDKAIQLFNKQ
ncbi:MAG: rRNA maturation RNase YbeY [Cytophagales bacterium]|nr:MAG: rRNA maturation RNase YbeY [Cytophagales bacterium]